MIPRHLCRRFGGVLWARLRQCREDPIGKPVANLITALAQMPFSAARGSFRLVVFDTKPSPPYNAPLVRANSASATILLWAFCPHRTHSARRLFRRALTRLALFSVSNGVWACSASSSPQACGPVRAHARRRIECERFIFIYGKGLLWISSTAKRAWPWSACWSALEWRFWPSPATPPTWPYAPRASSAIWQVP